MNNNVEIEAKVLLTKKQYLTVYESLKAEKGIELINQTNFYIDSKDRILKDNDIALRIREKRDEYVLTVKTPMSEGLLEKNQALDSKEANEMIEFNKFPKGEVAEFLELLDIDLSKLVVLAKMSTKRTTIEKKDIRERISLDVNTYGNKVDYELEVDKTAMALAEKRIAEILTPLNIKYELNTVSKQTRALCEAC
ncbi:MAG: CYTH domain-containing protein [Bacilli bacterium]|nr:CYTH domain-containing protein [Bacilli bacterium]